VLETPMLLIDSHDQLIWANESARHTLGDLQNGSTLPDIYDYLPKGYVYRLHAYTEGETHGTLLECIRDHDAELQAEVHRLRQENEELEAILNASSDELFIADGQGRILLVNQSVESLYGMKREDIIGKTVFELEANKVFYPSVTSMVLRDRRRQTILQRTKFGRQLAVTGSPVFDDEGKLVRVISTAIDMQELPWVSQTDAPPVPRASYPRTTSTPESEAFVARSQAMRDTLLDVDRIAMIDATILLLGETGVGKNRVARYVHDRSPRRNGAYVEINCAAVPESLFESELFGYERGAFTGSNKEGKAGKVELANGGTLFLNEIGELPLHQQAKVLDLLQSRTFTRVGGLRPITVDMRIIAATNRNLEEMVEKGELRLDLYYRLNVVPVVIPPLRQRPADIEPLCNSILTKLSRQYSQPMKRLHPAAFACLEAYAWPGNVRELQNVMEQLHIRVEEGLILPDHLPESLRKAPGVTKMSISERFPAVNSPSKKGPLEPTEPDVFSEGDTVGLGARLDSYEKRILADALAKWKTTYVIASHLGVSQPTVVRKLKQHGLSQKSSE
jgi:PAS domain S-box-containing protein